MGLKINIVSVNTKVKLAQLLAKYPYLYRTIFGIRYYTRDPSPYRRQLWSPKSDLVIEGYPRCANTYFTYSFIWATGEKYRVASHFHSIAQVIVAVKKGTPVAILVRNPVDAIVSFVAREPELSPQVAATYYLTFYKVVAELVEKILIVSFDDVIKDVNSQIQRVLRLLPKETTHEEAKIVRNNDLIFSMIEQRSAKNNKVLSEEKVPRPSSRRSLAKRELRDKVLQTVDAALLSSCNEVYNYLMERA